MAVLPNSILPSPDTSANTPDIHQRRHRIGASLIWAIVLSLTYYALARVSLLFLIAGHDFAAFWPANGLILAAMMVTPVRRWGYWLGSLALGNLAANLFADRHWGLIAGYLVANGVEVIIGAAVLRRIVPGKFDFTTVRQVLVFVLSCVVGSAIAAVAGAQVAVLSNHGGSSFGEAWRLWTVIDTLGLLVIVPALVTCYAFRSMVYARWRLLEAATLLTLSAIVCFLIFSGVGQPRSLLLNFPYVTLLPFLLWAGLRFDPRVAAALIVIMVSIGGWGTVNHRGPMSRQGHTAIESVVTLQFSAILWTLSALVLSAVTAERQAAAAAGEASEKRAHEAERRAIENHARLRAVFDNSRALIFLKDREGRYVEINRLFAQVIGRDREQIIGKLDLELFVPEIAQRLRDTDQRIWANNQILEYTTEWVLDGRPRTFRTTKVPVYDSTGHVWAICGMSMDVTEQLVSERELRLAKDRAETANRAKSEFLANISHEIRTPMTAIFGYAELLQSAELTETSRIEHVETIRRNGEHLLSILNDVLDMSKIEAGRMTVENLLCPVPALIVEVVSLLRQRASEKGLRLLCSCRTPIPEAIYTDPTRLRQILLNLIGNAVKFTEAGSVTVEVSLDESHRKPELVIEVTDTGIGMSADQVAALGEPFSQADPSHARRFGGSGLGLSIGYRLAELLGGSITCHSASGLGTTFTVRVPAGDLNGIARTSHLGEEFESVGVKELPGNVPLSGRLLVVEDSPDTLRLLLHHLTKAGLDADPAENGQSAVARAVGAWRSGRPYDLILMDLQMPQMDGLTAVRVLRGNGYTGRVVALTANAMDADRQRSVAAGCDGFLTKPILGDKLLEAVRQHLAWSRQEPVKIHSPPTQDGAARSTLGSISNVLIPPARIIHNTEVSSGHKLESELNSDPDVGPLIPEYLYELRIKASAISKLADAGEWLAVSRLAHQIKGSAGGYGFPSITYSAASVEASIKNKLPDAAVHLAVEALLALCDQATIATSTQAESHI